MTLIKPIMEPSPLKSAYQGPTPPRPTGFSVLRLLPLVAIVLGLAALFLFGIDDYLSFETLRTNRELIVEWTGSNYAMAVLGFIGAYFVAVTFSLPGAVWITLAGGFIFGTVATTLYVVVGATLGATAVFLAARYALGDFIHDKLHAKMGGAMLKMEKGFHENELNYLLVLRLVPLFPFWLVNLVPAFLGIRTRTYIIGTFFGIIPGTFVFSSAGNGLGAVFEKNTTPDLSIIFEPEILIPIIGLSVLSLIPIFYKIAQKKKKTKDDI